MNLHADDLEDETAHATPNGAAPAAETEPPHGTLISPEQMTTASIDHARNWIWRANRNPDPKRARADAQLGLTLMQSMWDSIQVYAPGRISEVKALAKTAREVLAKTAPEGAAVEGAAKEEKKIFGIPQTTALMLGAAAFFLHSQSKKGRK
jgi:hypothetical protein